MLNETLGRPDDALPLLREALQIRRDAGNQRGVALVLNNIGNAYLAKGQYSEAQTYFERALELREKATVPGELADTLHNLAATASISGRDDLALSRLLRALDLRRGAGDKRGAAIESYSIGTIFDHQARFGAAVKSKEEALLAFRDLKQRDVWLGEILSGYGNSLSMSGRLEEAGPTLEEALSLARELQNRSLIAQTLRFQADRLYYSGDVKGARALAEQAAQAAERASDRGESLEAQADVATITATQLPSKAVAAKLASLALYAETTGLPALAVNCSLYRAQTLLKLGDRAGARREADRALAKAETLGFRLALAKAHYLRSEAMRLDGDAEARGEYALALRLLEEIKGEDGSHDVLKRADIGAMHAESSRWSRTS